MKCVLRFTPVLILLTFLHHFAEARVNLSWLEDTISVMEAKKKGELLLSIRGAYHPNRAELTSAHYGKCIDLKMKNISDSVLNLVLESGTILLSRDSSTQDMLVTKTVYYSLKPDQRLADRVYAMCGELHKNAPDVYISYDIGTSAEAPLVRIARIIEQTGQQGQAGQYAVWAVSDGATKKDLGEDFSVLEKSQALLNKAGINFNIYGIETSMAASSSRASSAAPLVMPPSHQQRTVDIDTALLAVETTTVQTNMGIYLGKESENIFTEDAEGLLISTAGVMLLAFTLYYFRKDSSKKA